MKKQFKLAPLAIMLLVLSSCQKTLTLVEITDAKSIWQDARIQNEGPFVTPDSIELKGTYTLKQTTNGIDRRTSESFIYRCDKEGIFYAKEVTTITYGSSKRTQTIVMYMMNTLDYSVPEYSQDGKIGYIEFSVKGNNEDSHMKVRGDASVLSKYTSIMFYSREQLIQDCISLLHSYINSILDMNDIDFVTPDTYTNDDDNFIFKVDNYSGSFTLVHNGTYFEKADISNAGYDLSAKLNSYDKTIKVSNPDSYYDLAYIIKY